MKSLLIVTLVSILLGMMSDTAFAIQPTELTDDNFEHDTQATSGSTTGDWLILFCEF